MNEKLSLTELQLIIKDSLYLALPDMYWVIAEISEIKENYNGHCYLELVEKLPDETNIRSRVKAVIWSSRYRFIKSYFENSAGESLRDGLKILIRVKIEYHEIYGLSLVINDIDPAFTIGEMALKRQQILKKLEEEGVLTMNRDLDFPVVPQRIAVISSANAAGYTDFMKHLKGNSFGYVFYTVLFETPMQGKETESGIIKAFDRIASLIDKFDLAVIIRGGGSQTDLSWFDNYSIAYYITQFPLPVITGIGHEKDLSVTDIVAHRSLKTPTAVADFIIGCMNEAENHLIDLSNEITDRSILLLAESKMKIETARLRLIPVARAQLSSNRTALTRRKEILASASKNRLNVINTQLTGFINSLKILDPENVLKRGYTITSLNGKILKKCKQVKNYDVLDTKFSDGSIRSKVV
jgi:exodeoxyribonuclease VII large subunit